MFFSETRCSTYPRRHSRRHGWGVQSSLSVCLFVSALAGKRLELSTPNVVHVYSIAVVRHPLTQRSKGQKVKGQGHTVTKTVTVVRLLVTRAATTVTGVVCMSI